jgi:hypothetical protein
MVTQARDAVGFSAIGSFAEFADRWIWTVIAALFFVTVLAGFIPDSISKLEAVSNGVRPPLPGFMHFHAVVMGLWITLLLAQSTLMATGNRSFHMQLGMVSVVLIPAVAIGMVGVVSANFTQLVTSAPDLIPEDVLSQRRVALSNLLLSQARSVFLFSTLTFWAVLVRKEDSETHKRLMFVATVPLLSAAIDRMGWMHELVPVQQPWFMDVTQLAWLAPLLIYDLWRRRSLHKAYLIGIAVNLPLIVLTHVARGTDWWLAMAPKILGIEN